MGTNSWTSGGGPLAPFADGYKRKLVALGHKPTTVRQHLRLMGQLSGWLAGEGLGAGDLTRARAEEFLDARRTGGQRPPATMASGWCALNSRRSPHLVTCWWTSIAGTWSTTVA